MATRASNKPSHREVKKEECRQAITTAAVRLFEEKGFEATTMEEIAQAAKVSRPTVFNYFAHKEDILTVLGDMMGRRLAAQIVEIKGEAAFADPIATLRRILVTMASAFAEYPETSRAFHFLRMQQSKSMRKCANGRYEPPTIEQPMLDQMLFCVSLIEQGQQAGSIRKDFEPKEILRHLMIGLFASTMGPWLHGEYGDEPLPGIVERHFDLFVKGIRG